MSENRDRPHFPHHPPKPCEKCGSTNISVTPHHGYVEFKCNDCGHTWQKNFPPRPPKDEKPEEAPAE